MKKLILGLLILSLGSCKTQKIEKDQRAYNYTYTQKGKKHLIGLANEDILKSDPSYSSWYLKNYSNYSVNSSDSEYLAKNLKDYKVEVFMGTWCGDSKRGVPQIYKMIHASDLKSSNFDLYTVNRQKKSRLGEEQGKSIRKVPTLLVYKDGKEIGRIVETPIKTWENDLVKILKGEKYTPNYSK